MNDVKSVYVCSYCNKEYEQPIDRAKCEITCAKKKELEAEKLRKENLEKEKTARMKEIELKGKEYVELIRQFIKDYGSINLGYSDDDSFPYLSKLLGKWWF